MSVKVLGMGNVDGRGDEQDVWATTRSGPGMGVWLRSEPPRTGNAEFDKLMAAETGKIQGFPLKTVTVRPRPTRRASKTTTTGPRWR